MKVVLREDYQVPAVDQARQALTADRLRELLRYDPETGVFTWLDRPESDFATRHGWRIYQGQFAGTVAGTPDLKGYVLIRVLGTYYKAHRLAWLYMTGAWPEQHIDHKNGVKNDNRFANLRDVGRATNMENQRRASSRNSTGLLGVSPHRKTGKFCAFIKANGANRYLGLYPTPELAHAAYVEAKRQLHEGCTL